MRIIQVALRYRALYCESPDQSVLCFEGESMADVQASAVGKASNSDYEFGGQEFESLRARQENQ